jgi:hypothetical protein
MEKGRANELHRTCRGSGDGMQATGTKGNTGSPYDGRHCRSTDSPRGKDRVVWGDGEACNTYENRVMPVEGRSLS